MSENLIDFSSGELQTATSSSHKISDLLWRLGLILVVTLIIAAINVTHLQVRVVGFDNFWPTLFVFHYWYWSTLDSNQLLIIEVWGFTLCLFGLQVHFWRKRWKKVKCPFFTKVSKDSALHGTAQWASWSEIKEMAFLPQKLVDGGKRAEYRKYDLDDHEGVYIGSYYKKGKKEAYHLRHNGPEHLLAFAPTRSGKGVGLVLPTLYTWAESCLVHDPKGEAWALTAGYRSSLGQRCFNFDPANPDTHKIAAFNPLAEIRLGTSSEVGDAQNIATIVMDPKGEGLKDHWAKTGFSLLSGLILHCCYVARREENRYATFKDVVEFLSTDTSSAQDTSDLPPRVQDEMAKYARDNRGKDMPELKLRLLIMREYPHMEDGSTHEIIAQEAQTVYIKEEREQSSVVSTVISELGLYRDPSIARNISRSDWRIADLMHGDKPATAYLIVRPSDADRLRPLMRLILTQVVRQLTKEMEFAKGRSVASYKHRLLLLLDEFTALKKLDAIEGALAYMAGYGLKAYLIVQDLQQLQAVYGKEETILSNCHIRVCYAPNKIETAETISKMAGTRTVVHKAAKTKEDGQSQQISETSRPLITPEEVMRLKGPRKSNDGSITRPGDLLIFVAGHRPIYGSQMLYFQNKKMNERSLMPPPTVNFAKEGDIFKVSSMDDNIESTVDSILANGDIIDDFVPNDEIVDVVADDDDEEVEIDVDTFFGEAIRGNGTHLSNGDRDTVTPAFVSPLETNGTADTSTPTNTHMTDTFAAWDDVINDGDDSVDDVDDTDNDIGVTFSKDDVPIPFHSSLAAFEHRFQLPPRRFTAVEIACMSRSDNPRAKLAKFRKMQYRKFDHNNHYIK